VNEVFSEVAEKYDLMNDIMSFGVHRYWKQLLIERLNPYCGTKLLDTCGGTGDIAFEFIKQIKRNNDNLSKVVVCDINQKMLKVGQNRAQQLGLNDDKLIEWVLGDAMSLPFEDNSFDAYTVGFGIRNVVNIDKALLEANRVLKKGAIFLCLEFTQLKNPLLDRFSYFQSFLKL
jgi:ubiquinone/menaquinone biosynthesis methyltransferase